MDVGESMGEQGALCAIDFHWSVVQLLMPSGSMHSRIFVWLPPTFKTRRLGSRFAYEFLLVIQAALVDRTVAAFIQPYLLVLDGRFCEKGIRTQLDSKGHACTSDGVGRPISYLLYLP